MLIDGIHVPLTVPFERDGAVAWARLAANVRRYSLSPVAGLVAMAPGFEAGALDDAECLQVLQTVRSAASDDKVLVATVARESVRAALQLAHAAETAGFDAVLLVAPSLAQNERAVFLRSVADASPLPLMLWGAAMESQRLAELSHHENVLGVYQPELTVERLRVLQDTTAACRREVLVTSVFRPATRRMQAEARSGDALLPASSLGGTMVLATPSKPMFKLRSKVVPFQIMAGGSAIGMLQSLEAGAAGAMPSLAACCPQAVFEVYAAWKDGDSALAAEKGLRLLQADALLCDLNIAGIKYACDVNGYAGGPPRLPRLGLTARERELVENVLRETPS
jgi:4-hydroxy-2-oxoglutarate aldolase